MNVIIGVEIDRRKHSEMEEWRVGGGQEGGV